MLLNESGEGAGCYPEPATNGPWAAPRVEPCTMPRLAGADRERGRRLRGGCT